MERGKVSLPQEAYESFYSMFDKKQISPKFQINFVVRDKSGNSTGKKKTFASNKAKDVAFFFNRHQSKKTGHSSKGSGGGKKGGGSSKGKEA